MEEANVILIQTIISGLIMGAIYGLIAVGLNLIWGMMEIVNFAHGESMMLNMYLVFFLFTLLGIDPIYSLPVCLAFSFGLGLIIYHLVIRRILTAPMLAQIFATFGLGIFLRSGAQFLWSPDFRTIKNPMIRGNINLLGIYIGKPQIVGMVICIMGFLFLYILIKHTKLGMALQAAAEDREAASLMGINHNKMFALGFGFGIACVGVAGNVLSTFYYIFPEVGFPFALIAYIAVALGGFGSVFGALLAGLIIGLVEVLGGFLFIPAFKYAFVCVIYLLVVFIRPQGLFGRY